MDIKTLFGLTVVPAAFLGGAILACLSKTVRDLFFLLLVSLSPLIERLDVNYVSREWYRGTSRGFEVVSLDVLMLGVLIGSVLFPRRGQIRAFWPASFGLMLLYFFYAAANVAFADPRLFGLFELTRMFRGLLLVLAVAFYLRSEREVRLLILGVAVLIIYESLLALKQRYIDGTNRVPGTLIESNSLSVLLCTTTPLMVAALSSRLPWLLRAVCAAAVPLAMVAEVLTISRAGVTIMGLVLFATALATVRFRLNVKTVSLTLLALLGVGGIVAKSWKTLGERFDESTLKQEYENKRNMGRGYYLRMAQAIVEDRFFGVGLNNWSYWVSNKYGPQHGYRFVPYHGVDDPPSDVVPPTSNVDEAQAAPAHSLGALTMGELGVPGFVLFTLVWLRWFQMGSSFLRPRDPDPMRRVGVGLFFALCGMFFHCLTEWVFRHLPLYYVIHILVGALMSLYYIQRKARREVPAADRLPASDERRGIMPAPELAQLRRYPPGPRMEGA